MPLNDDAKSYERGICERRVRDAVPGSRMGEADQEAELQRLAMEG
jgi:hypothetical protein